MTLLSCEVVAGPRLFEAHARSQIPGTRRLYEDTDGQRSLTPAMAQFSQPGTIIRSKWTYPQFQGGSRYGNYGPPGPTLYCWAFGRFRTPLRNTGPPSGLRASTEMELCISRADLFASLASIVGEVVRDRPGRAPTLSAS
jgi:hypothetical protein